VGIHTWKWARPGSAIGPSQYQEFEISAGPLPAPGELVLPVTQTYSDGKVVSWAQPARAGQPEPEHPAPAFEVTAATGSDDDAVAAAPASGTAGGVATQSATHASAATADPTARWLGGVALVVALLAAAGVVVTRRRPGKDSA